MVLVLGRRELDGVVSHCRELSPVEACGVLVGEVRVRARLVRRVFKTRNVLGSSSAYQIDPEELLRVFLEAEAESMEVLGFYHSHPFSSARPSEVDRSSAYYPGYSYLICSILLNELKSYVWRGDRFVPEALRVV